MGIKQENRQKILIVDDQFGIRILLREVLKKEGYEVFEAANGIQALSSLAEDSPDLVMLDMKIPGLGGVGVLKQIKQKDMPVKVVVMTAFEENEMIETAKEYGVSLFFKKPFDIEDVLACIKKECP